MEDRRIIKTKKAIREAFLEMRKTLPPERIKVKDLCAMAHINRATFYRYYLDIPDLTEQIEEDAVNELIDNLHHQEHLFKDTEKFIYEIPSQIGQRLDCYHTLFSGRENVMFSKLEEKLIGHYSSIAMTHEEELIYTFIIHGLLYSMRDFSFRSNIDKMAFSAAMQKAITALLPLLPSQQEDNNK